MREFYIKKNKRFKLTIRLIIAFTLFSSINVFAAKDRFPDGISIAPASSTVNQNDPVVTLTASVTTTTCGNGGTTDVPYTYQWYSDTDATPGGGSIIVGETSDTYNAPTGTAGTFYYYCVVSWNAGSNCAPAGTINSNSSTVIVNSTGTCFDGIQNQDETGIDCGGVCPACVSPGFQIDNVTQTSGSSVSVCSGNLTDNGGDSGNYGNNEDYTLTICSGTTDGIQLTFTSFSTESSDRLYIYDGSDVFATPIGTYSGSTSPGTIYSSGTCLTLRFDTDFSVVDSGFEATISCYTPTCSDGIQNQSETGIDCGGPCSACETCSDGIQNQDETGVDCGGVCPACPSCSDGILNQDETSIDCGGVCGPCPGFQIDNVSQNSGATVTTCTGILYDSGGSVGNYSNNEDITITLCTGSTDLMQVDIYSLSVESCCDNLKVYDGANTSASLIGTYTSAPGVILGTGTCLTLAFHSDFSTNNSGFEARISCETPPTCSDGIQNQDETGIDCGGVCPACAETCSDGIQNQDETGVDCGGVCPACTGCNEIESNDKYGEAPTITTMCTAFIGTPDSDWQGDLWRLDLAPGDYDFNWVGDGCTRVRILEFDSSYDPAIENPNGTPGASDDCGFSTVSYGCWHLDNRDPGLPNQGMDETLSTTFTVVAGRFYYFYANPHMCVDPDQYVLGETLPVELIDFRAEQATNSINLYWTTASEINNDYFEIEISNDMKSFVKIGEVDGYGNSTTDIDYQFSYLSNSIGTYYFRLKQVDYDGKFEYSQIIAVNDFSIIDNIIDYKSNYFSDENSLHIVFDTQVRKSVNIEIIDCLGRIIYKKKHRGGTNSHQIEIPIILNKGTYIVNVYNDTHSKRNKIVSY